METFEEQARERLGEVIGGKWRLESVLGVGGMAAVYAAREPGGTVAAIKLLHAEMGVRREIRERFLREGYVANSIDHPGVVRALEHGASADDQVFLAMELLSGETMLARIRRHGGLPLHELLDYMDQILDVLAVAHARGVVHRDLKPDNLFISGDGRIKILDFGLARVHESMPGDHRTRSGVALGTLPYMAPEQALGRRAEIDGRVDLFALGATAFRILSGRKVHEAESEAELLIAMASRPAPPLLQVAPRLPPDVCMVIDLALAFQRDARYPDARTMQADVRALRNGQRPGYALARLSALGDATRVDRAAPSVAAGAGPGPGHGLGSTFGPGVASVRSAEAHAALPGGSVQAPVPMSGTAAQPSRGFPLWAWLLLGGFFFVTGAGAVVAYFLLYGPIETNAEPARAAPGLVQQAGMATSPEVTGAPASAAALPAATPTGAPPSPVRADVPKAATPPSKPSTAAERDAAGVREPAPAGSALAEPPAPEAVPPTTAAQVAPPASAALTTTEPARAPKASAAPAVSAENTRPEPGPKRGRNRRNR